MLVFDHGINDNELCPCPVCGESAVFLRIEPYHKNGYYYSVQCTDCCEETECYKVPEMAAYEWSQIKKEKLC